LVIVGCPSERIKAKPRAIVIIARVATNGAILALATSRPEILPSISPIIRVAETARGSGM
jgi:hypothetical protein